LSHYNKLDHSITLESIALAIVLVSVPAVVISTFSLQIAKAQSSSESDSYDRGAAIGNNVGVWNGYNNGPYSSVDPSEYCNGDAECISGFESTYQSGYSTGDHDHWAGYNPNNDMEQVPEGGSSSSDPGSSSSDPGSSSSDPGSSSSDPGSSSSDPGSSSSDSGGSDSG
jgi:hypothetical protein